MIDSIEPDDSDFLFAEAKLGADVERFLNSDIGRYLVGRAKAEVQEATSMFLNSNVDRSHEEILRAKRKALAAQTVVTWLTEAFDNGMNSLVALQEAGD